MDPGETPREHAEPTGPRGDGRAAARARYDALARRYDARWSRYVRRTARAAASDLDLRPGDRLLDAGAGTGVLLERLSAGCPGARLVGLDLSPGMIAVARARLRGRAGLVLGDVERLPFPAGHFQRVVSVSSLHYWSRPRRALDELTRVLAPGGRLVIVDWCRDFLTIRLTDRILRARGRGYGRALRAAELARLLAAPDRNVRLRRFRAGAWWGMMSVVATKAA